MTTETLDPTSNVDFSDFPTHQEVQFTDSDRSKPVIDVATMTKIARTWGEAIALSRQFGVPVGEAGVAQGFIIALECLKKGLTPSEWAERYQIVSGKKSMKAEAMRSAFMAAGGKIKWLDIGDSGEIAKAMFTAPDGQKLEVQFTIQDARRLGVSFKADSGWSKDPGAMLRARVTSKALRIVAPEILGGCYLPDETAEFVGSVEDAKPQATARPASPETKSIDDAIRETAAATKIPKSFLSQLIAKISKRGKSTLFDLTITEKSELLEEVKSIRERINDYPDEPYPWEQVTADATQQPAAPATPAKPTSPPDLDSSNDLASRIKAIAPQANVTSAHLKSMIQGLGGTNLASLPFSKQEQLLRDLESRARSNATAQEFLGQLNKAGFTGDGPDEPIKSVGPSDPPFEATAKN